MLAAVSGGSDSSALLLLLRDHLREHASHLRLLAVTVDHALREGSAAEAEGVARFAEAVGVQHRILPWTGPKPPTGLPAAARNARYRLLKQVANEARARIVFTGHTADDQAETVAMRLTRGEGRGLAGMAPVTLFDGSLWIARPLLAARREELRQLLLSRGVGWVDDPTNDDARFERALVREELLGVGSLRLHEHSGLPGGGSPTPSWASPKPPLPPPEGEERSQADAIARPSSPSRGGRGGLGEAQDGVGEPRWRGALPAHGERRPPTTDELLRVSRMVGEARLHECEQAAELIEAFADRPADGLFRLSPEFQRYAPRSAAIEALRFLLATVGGREFPVDALRGGALFDRLGQSSRMTLGGVLVERRSDAVFLVRENRGIASVQAGDAFDNRFRLSAAALPGHVEAWGDAVRAEQLPLADALPRSLLWAAMASAPAFRLDDGRLVPLDQAGIVATPVVAPFRHFLPGFDLSLAQALARLVGAPALPPSPYRGHFAGAG